MKLQHLLVASCFSFVLAAGVLPAADAQEPQQQGPPPKPDTVRICEGMNCTDRPRNSVSTETVNHGAGREEPDIARLEQFAETRPKAAYDLGLRYFRGDGVRQDSYRSLVWMRKAAERGNLQAQKALGAFYLFGLEEMGSDPQEAEKWLSLAVSQGDKESKNLLEQAREAKKSKQADYKRRERERERERSVCRNNWNSGYQYYGIWRQTQWYGY